MAEQVIDTPIPAQFTAFELMLLVGSLNQNIADFKKDKMVGGAGILQLNMLAKKIEELLKANNISL